MEGMMKKSLLTLGHLYSNRNALAAIGAFLVLSGYQQTHAHQALVTTFLSPDNLQEECHRLPQIPEGKYSNKDMKSEELYCSIDFYDSSAIALCPKTWSTSPGTMIYDISNSGQSQQSYEAQPKCGGSKSGHVKLSKFKQSMNQNNTSGTYSPASLLYYHFSRYFDTSVTVPVAVLRTMSRQAHFDRVTSKAHRGNMGKGPQIRAGWEWLYNALINPQSYRPPEHIFFDNFRQIYGSIADGGGERYGSEINGIRSAWGDAQNYDFQKTPAFIALATERPLSEAISIGLTEGQRVGRIRTDMGGGASPLQMAIWMKELTEIVILDHIFQQQDRIGNIDYKWHIYWVDSTGQVQEDRIKSDLPRSQISRISYPSDKNGAPTQLIQRTQLNDNDAAGLKRYANFTARTRMVERLRHISSDTYQKLQFLNQDFQSQGPLYQYLKGNFTLSPDSLSMIVQNTQDVATTLEATCRNGRLRFDLRSIKALIKDEPAPPPPSC